MDWYYEQGGTRVGPVRREDFNRLVGEGKIGPDTPVWREGMAEWQPWRAVAPPKRVTAVCCQCRREFLVEDMVRYDAWQVCATCKPVFFQRVKEGCPPTRRAAGVGAGEELNPWFSIWLKPRATIQQIVDRDPRRLVLVLAALDGLSHNLARSSGSVGDKISFPVLLLAIAVGGPLIGLLSLFVGGAVLRWTGKWIGGRATGEEIRAAMAWSSVPLVWLLALRVPRLALFGHELFTRNKPMIDASPALKAAFWSLASVETVVVIWAYIVFLHCLGQVQSFSAWKALGNTLLAWAVVFVPLMLILGVVVLAVLFAR